MSRLTKWTLGAGISFIVAACVGYWFAHHRADAAIEKHSKQAAAGLAQFARRVVMRPALAAWPAGRPADERPRDARRIYERVLTRLDAISQTDLETLPENRYEDLEDIDEQAVRAFVVSHQGILDELHDVLYADRMSTDPRWADGVECQAADITRWQKMHRFLQGATRNALVLDKPQVAVTLIPVRLYASKDLARSGVLIQWLIGTALTRTALDDARLLLARQAPDDRALADWACALDRLGANHAPLSACWEAEKNTARLNTVNALHDGSIRLIVEAEIGWRSLFSTKLWLADGLEQLPAVYSGFIAIGRLSVHERAAAAQRSLDDLPADAHDLEREVLAVGPRVFLLEAEIAMHWHLLRVSVALAQHRAEHASWPDHLENLVPRYLPRIDVCPLSGVPLGYANGRVWSIGGDGVDDHGRPQADDAEVMDSGDVVFDLNDKKLPDPFADYR